MWLQTTWFVLYIFIISGYAILDGFDLGVGMLSPIVARNDHDRRILQAHPLGRLGQAVGARGMIGAGRHRFETGGPDGLRDPLAVGGDGDSPRTGARCALCHAHHHRQPADVRERLVR